MVTIAIAIAISTSRTIWAIGIWTQLLCELLLLGLHELFALVLGILECLLLGLADLLDLLGSHPVWAVWVGSVSIAVVATDGGGGRERRTEGETFGNARQGRRTPPM